MEQFASSIEGMKMISDIMLPIGFILFALILIFNILMLFSSKFRGKLMAKMIRSQNEALKESRKDLSDMMSTGIDIQKDVIEKSKDDIAYISKTSAEANKEGIEITARAIKKGLSEDEGSYCVKCGAKLAAGSRYCHKCGAKQPNKK